VDLEVYRAGNSRVYAGVFRPGTGKHYLWVCANKKKGKKNRKKLKNLSSLSLQGGRNMEQLPVAVEFAVGQGLPAD
jgi:hypothetical protein